MDAARLAQELDALLGIPGHPDYPTAVNGLQVGGPTPVRRVGAAVDASARVISMAADAGVDFLIVHHGLFWEGLQPLTGRLLARVEPLLRHGIALYSAHLPLDAHPDFGNSALLARQLGLTDLLPFGLARGVPVGWIGEPGFPPGPQSNGQQFTPDLLSDRLSTVVQGPVRLIRGGGEVIERVAVVTGGAGSMVEEAALAGAQAFVTGEGAHHTHALAMELGIHLLYGGHYATETFGVAALAGELGRRHGLPWVFLDDPSGL